MVGVKGAGDINLILALLEDVFGGLRVWDNWLQPGGTSLCRTLSLFLDTLGGSCGENWTLCIACGWGLSFGRVSKSIWIAVSHWNSLDVSARAKSRRCEAEFDIVSLSFSKRAGWPVGFGAIRIIKKRPRDKSADHQSLLPQAQRDTQRESMKLSYQSRGAIMWTKLQNSEEALNRFISVKWVTSYWGWCAAVWKENSSRVQRRGQLVVRLIANKCYEDIFHFLFFLPLPSGLLID